jgi:Mor family transcriptional regulator
MAYINADSLFPPELLQEVQKYVQGSLVYIPRPEDQKLSWGAKSGARELFDRRNAAIKAAKAHGKRIDDLADEYGLSSDGIRKVLYGSENVAETG